MTDSWTDLRTVRSLCTLYGGAKNQRKNFTRVPTGSLGKTCVRHIDEDGIDYYLVKFGHIWVRAAASTLEFATLDSCCVDAVEHATATIELDVSTAEKR